MNKENNAGREKKTKTSGNENSSNFDASHYKVFSASARTHTKTPTRTK